MIEPPSDREPRPSGRRGAPVVCLLVVAPAGLRASLGSVLTHTPGDVPVVVAERTAGSDRAQRCLADLAAQVPVRDVPVQLRVGQAADPAVLAAALAPADLVLVQAPCRVGPGWLEGLRTAAYLDVAVATAVAASPGVRGPARAAPVTGPDAAVVTVHPRVAEADGPCRYVRRSAIELAALPTAPDAVELGPQFARRCVRAGLFHVLADDVIVDPGVASPPDPLRAGADREAPAPRALDRIRRARDGLSVIVDARNLDGPADGTRMHVLELVLALARSGRARVTALVPERLSQDVRAVLEQAPALELVCLPAGDPPPGLRADVVHRPFQVTAHADLVSLGALADRLLITHQDLISFHSPDHFESAAAWAGYRAMTRRALSAADGVVFFSAYVRDGALAEDLVQPDRASVVALGVNHASIAAPPVGAPAPPAGSQALRKWQALAADGEVILCLGADFWHKNRLFALRVVQALQRYHEWRGHLVMAGPAVPRGSSRAAERALLAEDPRLAAAVLELGPVSDGEKGWLLDRAGLVLYPTVEEGFGLVPFEAAAHGRPCLWASGSALAELLPPSAAGIVPWDVEAAAGAALGLLRDADLSAANVIAVNAAGAGLRWELTAERMVAFYEAVCAAPPSPVARLERAQGLMQSGLSDDAVRLVGPGGALPRELERPLLALATHRRIGRPLLGAVRVGYRAARSWSRRRGG